MVSRTILSRLRLPFRHIGLWEYPGCGPAPCRRLTAGGRPPETLQSPVHLAQQIPGHALCIPPHRLIMYVIIAYPACKIKRKVSLSANSGAGGGRAGANGRAGRGFRPSGARGGGALGRRIDGVISGRGRSSFFKKDFTNDTQLYII